MSLLGLRAAGLKIECLISAPNLGFELLASASVQARATGQKVCLLLPIARASATFLFVLVLLQEP